MESLSNADLLKNKDDIEKQISDLFQVLESNGGVGMDAPLIDKEGFPRSDIDVYAVRQARNQVICLKNDHKRLMKLIEDRIHEVHSIARETGTVSSRGNNPTPQSPCHNRQPFATITMVTAGSPAALSRSIRVLLLRNSQREKISLSVTPHKWSGRGLLGCTIVPTTL